MGCGHATVHSPPFLHPVEILGTHAHAPTLFSKPLGQGLELYSWSCGTWLPFTTRLQGQAQNNLKRFFVPSVNPPQRVTGLISVPVD